MRTAAASGRWLRAQLTCGLLVLAAALPGPAAAQALDTRLIASGLTQPLYATAPLADGRVFIVELGGTIKVAQGGIVSTFLNFAVASGGEQGLLGLAFDPGYADATSAGYRRFFEHGYVHAESLTIPAKSRVHIRDADADLLNAGNEHRNVEIDGLQIESRKDT